MLKKTIVRVEVGEEYTAADHPPGSGYFRATAVEPGYTITIKDQGISFVSDSELEAARLARGVKQPISNQQPSDLGREPGLLGMAAGYAAKRLGDLLR